MAESPEKSVRLFNEALALLHDYFSHRRFKTRGPLTTAEVEANPHATIPFTRAFADRQVNILYCPPGTYYQHVKFPLLHVRVYNPDRAEPVAELLRGMGLKPKVEDNEPYSKMDIDAVLR